MKKLFFLFSFLTCVMAASAAVGEMIEQNGIHYYVYADNTVEVIANPDGGTLYAGEIAIPATITHDENTYSVIRISTNAFKGCQELTSVTLSDGLTEIQSYAFQGSSLTSITLPNTLTSIGSYAFQNCTSLTQNIVIPASVTTISSYAFSGSGITGKLEIPQTVTSIGGYAFYLCKGLTELSILGNTKLGTYVFQSCTGMTTLTISDAYAQSLPSYTFDACSSLKDVTLSNNITGLSTYTFRNCESLESIVIGSGTTWIGVGTFYSCDNLKTVQLPETLTGLSQLAFYFCQKLETINLPASLTAIGSNAFGYCHSWKVDLVIPDKVTVISDLAFDHCTGLKSVTFPVGLTEIQNNAFSNCTSLAGILDIPNNVTTIGASAFNKCYQLTGLVLGEKLTSIGDNAFYNCTNLTGSVIIPDMVTSIGNNAFQLCSNLTDLKLGAAVTTIGSNAFRGCSNLASLTLGEKITSIGAYAFYSLPITGALNLPSIQTLGDYAFAGCKNISSLSLGNTITTINSSTFASCTGLSGTLTIPESVTTIEDNAFNNCNQLTAIVLGNGVTKLGVHPFKDCSSVTEPVFSNHLFAYMPPSYHPENTNSLYTYTIPEGIKTIASYAFYQCAKLYAVNMPNQLQTIDSYAFHSCIELTSADIPESVTTLGEGIFRNCPKLGSAPIIRDGVLIHMPNSYIQNKCENGVYPLPSDVYKIDSYAFLNCSSLTNVEIHDGLTEIGLDAFSGCTNLTQAIHNGTLFAYMPPTYNNGEAYEYSIPEGISKIASHAFRNCVNLTKVTIGENVTSVGKEAFIGCSNLKSVVWNAKHCADFDTKEVAPFYDVRNSITSFVFGDAVEYIPARLCYDMNYITSIRITDNVKTVGDYMSYECDRLTTVYVGESIEKLAQNVFSNSPITYITWNAKNCADYSSYGTGGFHPRRAEIMSITFGDAVEHIPAHLCEGYWKITSLTVPQNVKTVGSDGLNLTGLTTVVWNAKHCETSNPLFNSTAITSFTFGNAVEHIPSSLCASKSKITSITIPASVKTIGSSAFSGCLAIKEVTLPEGLTTIESSTFQNCHSLTSMVIPDGVTTINGSAFANCVALRSVVIPENIQTIVHSAFNNCTGLRTVTWNAKRIADYTKYDASLFYNLRGNITSFTFGKAVEHIPSFLCYEMTKLSSITIPASVTSIGQQAFNHCSSLTRAVYEGSLADWCGVQLASESANPTYCAKAIHINGEVITDLSIPAGVASIGNYTFANYETLKSITISNDVTTIGKYAFTNCINAQSVVIGENVTSIGTKAFNACTGLRSIAWNAKNYSDFTSATVAPFYHVAGNITSFTLGDAVEYIPAYLCINQSNIASIAIPRSVTGIGTKAFMSCTNLAKTNYEGSVAEWCAIQFADATSNPVHTSKNLFIDNKRLTNLIIPEHVAQIGQYAFNNCNGISTVRLEHTTALPTVGTNAFTSSITGSAYLYVDCFLQGEMSGTVWNDFVNKHHYSAYITVHTNNAAYGTARATKQPDCDGNGGKLVATPATNCRFLGWDDGNTDNPRTLDNVTNDMTFTAIFAPYITVTTDGNISDLTWGDNQTDLSDCDIVVANGATLTCDVTTTVKNITVQAGGKLVVADGNTLTVTEVFTAQSKDDEQPQILTEGTGAIAYGDFQFVKNIPADRYYFFSLPFESETSNVTIDNGKGGQKSAAYNSDWNYLYYDGAGFAQKPSNESYWMTAGEGTIRPNQGYAVGVDAATADTYRELVFKPTAGETIDFSLNQAYSIAVAENPLRDDYVHPDKETFKGWNFIMNPYTSDFSAAVGSLSTPYVTIPDPGQSQTYTQKLFDAITLPPFFGFFVQVDAAGEIVFTPQNTKRRTHRASRITHSAPRYVGITLSNGEQEDETTLVIGEQYTTDYEIGSDLMKMIGYGNKPQVYTYHGSTKYAFKSINEATAAQVQPMGVYLPATGTYTFSLRDKHVAQAVYLYDYEANTVTNLAETDYTFTSGRLNSEKRFAISASFAPSQTTALPTADNTAAFTVHQDGDLHITLQGVAAGDDIRIINVHGQVVMQWTAMDTTTEAELPQAGLYIIERTSAMGIQVNKIVIQ